MARIDPATEPRDDLLRVLRVLLGDVDRVDDGAAGRTGWVCGVDGAAELQCQ